MKTSSEIFYKHPKYEIYEANEEGHIVWEQVWSRVKFVLKASN